MVSQRKTEAEYFHRGQFKSRKAVLSQCDLLINKILNLETVTNPKNNSAEGKDFDAQDTLHWTGRLVEILAGWAIDHQIGLAMNKLSSVQVVPSELSKQPDYLKSLEAVDTHEHECLGSTQYKTEIGPKTKRMTETDGRFHRRLLANLFERQIVRLPYHIDCSIIKGFEAADRGEIPPIFDIPNSRRKGTNALQLLRLEALEFVEYRVGRGAKRPKARREVSEAFGVSTSTLEKWHSRLAKGYFEEHAVKVQLTFAKNYGVNAENARKRMHSNDLYDRKYHESMLKHFERKYGKKNWRPSEGHMINSGKSIN